jgi:hypothetical protein
MKLKQQTVTVGGRTDQAYGTACLQPNGNWEIIDTRQPECFMILPCPPLSLGPTSTAM